MTNELLANFRSGLAVRHPNGGQWFATLDAISPEDNQVSAVVRLCSKQPVEPVTPALIEGFGPNRNRKPFETPMVASTNMTDLVITYSFLHLFSVAENLHMFQEFASNELGRLK